MNKKEQAYVEELKTRLALRWTEPVEPDIAPPSTGSTFGTLTKGYLPIGESSDHGRVEIACSSSVYHGIGSSDRTTSQQPRSLYSTRLLALRALRHATERRCANLLRRIDRMIEEEEGAGQ